MRRTSGLWVDVFGAILLGLGFGSRHGNRKSGSGEREREREIVRTWDRLRHEAGGKRHEVASRLEPGIEPKVQNGSGSGNGKIFRHPTQLSPLEVAKMG